MTSGDAERLLGMNTTVQLAERALGAPYYERGCDAVTEFIRWRPAGRLSYASVFKIASAAARGFSAA
jgi:hypothetical protein